MIYIASDHGGFELKNHIIDYLKSNNIEVTDMGPFTFVMDDDYPDYVIPTMHKILENSKNRGIVICRNGVGVSMLANKFNGIRAGLTWDEEHTKSTVNDDNVNVLALPSNYISKEKALNIVKTWLETPFKEDARFVRRLAKVKAIGGVEA